MIKGSEPQKWRLFVILWMLKFRQKVYLRYIVQSLNQNRIPTWYLLQYTHIKCQNISLMSILMGVYVLQHLKNSPKMLLKIINISLTSDFALLLLIANLSLPQLWSSKSYTDKISIFVLKLRCTSLGRGQLAAAKQATHDRKKNRENASQYTSRA